MPRRIGKRLWIALDISVPVDTIVGRIRAGKLAEARIVVARAIVVQPRCGIGALAGVAVAGGHRPTLVARAAIGGIELAGSDVTIRIERFGDAALVVGDEVGERAIDGFGQELASGVEVVGGSGRGAVASDFYQGAQVAGGGGRAAAGIGDLLGDTLALAIVEVAGGGRRAAGRVLPGCEPSLGIPGELLAGARSPKSASTS